MTAHADKSVLVTGCSSGIGRCIALGLANRGYRVFATVRQQQDIEALTRDGLDSLQLDLSDPASIDQAVSAVLRLTGGALYALINNGAYGQSGAVEDLSRDVLRAQFEANLFPHCTDQFDPGPRVSRLPGRLQCVEICPRGAVRHHAAGTSRHRYLRVPNRAGTH